MQHDSEGLKGFTLIELAVVLVVIGLVIGGVLVGRDLVANSQIRTTISQLESLNSAANAFRDKFGSLPGDYANAQAQWGVANNCAAMQSGGNGGAWPAANTMANGTCNGNGNGILEGDAGTNIGEPNLFFDHLLKASLLNSTPYFGPYLRINGGGVSYTAYETIVSKGIGGQIALQPVISFLTIWPAANSKSWYSFGPINTNIGSPSTHLTGLLTPAQAFAIDNKIDDGLPNTGKVLSMSDNYWGDHSDCFISVGGWQYSNYTSATYNLAFANPANTNPNGCQTLVQTGF